MKAHHLRAPESLDNLPNLPTVFLAGSIDQGFAENWQNKMVDLLADVPIVLLNPRRGEWDPAWDARPNHPIFREQFEWEQYGLEQAELVVFYFASTGDSPISLLELGLLAGSRKVVVCCSKAFPRKQNVDLVCERYAIPQVDSVESLAAFVRCAAPLLNSNSTHAYRIGVEPAQLKSAA